MSPRRRFDGVQLRRSRNGTGLRVVFADPQSPATDHAVAIDDNDPSSKPGSTHRAAIAPARLPRARRLRRRGEVKSILLTVLGSDRPPVSMESGVITIGRDASNDIVLDVDGIQPVHARITLDNDGAMLRLLQPDLDVRLNQRRVESLAFLHDGDILELGGTPIAVQVTADAASTNTSGDPGDGRVTRVRRVAPRFILRGVTGSQFGRLIPIYGRLVIGRSSDCDLILDEPGLSRRHAVIEALPDGLFLRDLGSANGSFLNGNRVRDASLRHGDQIVVESVRFLVQAIEQLDQPAPPLAVRAAPNRALRWLGWGLAGLALFAAGIAATLLVLR